MKMMRMNPGKILLLLAVCISSVNGFSQWKDRAYIGLGWNVGKFAAANSLNAYARARDFTHDSVVTPLDLSKLNHGPGLHIGLEMSEKFSLGFSVNMNRLRGGGTYVETTSQGFRDSYENYRFKLNSWSVTGAYGTNRFRAGISIDYNTIRGFVQESVEKWRRFEKNFNFGVSAQLEITPFRYFRVVPYLRYSFFRGSIQDVVPVTTYGAGYISLNHLMNYGVTAYILIPIKQ